MTVNRIYRCTDGSEVHESPAPFDMAESAPYTINSPTWRVLGFPGCDAEDVAKMLCEEWELSMERTKARMSEHLASLFQPKEQR